MKKIYDNAVSLLTTYAISFTIHEHTALFTMADAKDCPLFPIERILKTIGFKNKEGGYILAVVCGLDRVDYRKLATAVDTKRSNVVQISSEEVKTVFGVEPGSVGPLTMKENAQVLFDSKISTNETVFCGIGHSDHTLEIGFVDLVKMSQGRVVPLVKDIV